MNRRTKVAIVWLFVSIVSFIIMLLPFLFEDVKAFDFFEGVGGAMVMIGALLGLTGIITSVLYFRMGKREARITGDAGGQLARWEYTDEEWRAFANLQYRERIKDNKAIWLTIAVISLICIVPLWFMIQDLVFIILFIAGLMAFLSIFIVLPPLVQRGRILRSPHLAVISDNGVEVGKELALFDFKISWLDSLDIGDDVLTFTYSAIAAPTVVQTYPFRVPVKKGREADIDRIVAHYAGLEKPPKIHDRRGGKPAETE
jgi:hypothetical protein